MPGSSLSRRVYVPSVFLAAVFFLLASCDATLPNASGQGSRPYLVLVSFDGFRWDYASLTDTPALDRMTRNGLKAEALEPAFPTLTFPNHYSIATGVLPWRHGIVANDFPDGDGRRWYRYKDRTAVQDGRWYLAEPIWVTAEKAGLRTAAFYFVGTEADVGGVRPGHWRAFDANVPDRARVEQVLDWLAEPEESRPQLITLYFETVDDYGHWYGPDSQQNLAAIRGVDSQLGALLDGIEGLPHGEDVTVILVSDHGQAAYEPLEPFVLDEWIDLEGVTVVSGGPYAFIHFAAPDEKRAIAMRDTVIHNWDCGGAWLPGDMPAVWNAGRSDRYPDLVVLADPGCAVIGTEASRGKITAGDHGWSPLMPEMRGIFYAVGPRIPAGALTGPAHVTDVYPLMLELLGLEAPGPVDGDREALAARLLPEKE